MMNRQLRRAQAKMDKKADREKEERKEARRQKIMQMRERRVKRREEIKARAAAGKPTTSDNTRPSVRRAGRFSGALMIATVFFLVLQASVPPQPGDNELLRSITGAGFYLLFGYFSTLWLLRRGVPRPLLMTWITGGMLLAGVETAKWVQGWVVPLDPLMLGLAVPGVVAGSFLGRLVYENTPA